MQMLKNLINSAIEQNASDIHISENNYPLFRIDGDLQPAIVTDNLEKICLKSEILPLLSKEQQQSFQRHSTVDFAFDHEATHRVRGNMFNHNLGTGISFRLITKEIPTIDTLGLNEDFNKILELPNGLVLITGATGSGKSSTLAALLNQINVTQKKHIITIEDPIEYVHKSQLSLITQKQVGRDTPNYNIALEASLREDPDIIMIGEMREPETIRLAITAAETGHLVFATMHTVSAADTIDRLIYSFADAERTMICSILAEVLRAVVSQRLIKQIGGGRVAARELLFVNRAIANLIKEHKIPQITSSMQTGKLLGMKTLQQDIEQLIAAGKIAMIDDMLFNDDVSND